MENLTYETVRVDQKPTEHQIFFAKDYGHIIRIDNVSHEIAKNLKEQSEGNTWFSREINMKDDKTQFDTLPEDAKRAFKLNIIYQTLMDSGVTAGITDAILGVTTTPIWDILYRRIAIEETIHAESYSYCLNEVFGSETSDIIDLIYTDSMVQTRMQDEAALFKKLYLLRDGENLAEKQAALLETLIALYSLESIKFPFSFFVTFSINDSYNNAIPGFVQNIRLIAHDELNTHVPTGIAVMRILRDEAYQGFGEFFQSQGEEPSFFEKTVINTVEKVVEQELLWAKYLFEGRDVKGLNERIAEYFIKWRANLSLEKLGISQNRYTEYKENAITTFFNNYRDINKHNSALQEVSNTAYQKGQIKNDL